MTIAAYNSNGKRRGGGLGRRVALAAVLVGAWAGAVAISLASAQPRADGREARQTQPGAAGANIAQNDEVRVLVTPGWSTTANVDAIGEPLSKLGPHVLLNDGNYTLALAYHAVPPATATDTRFTEIFAIPWLKADQLVGCSFYMRRKQQVINENLILVSLWFNSADAGVAEACGVPAGAGARWFAAFFTNATGGFFLRSTGAGCGEKAYVLTTDAKMPRDLPVADDDKLGDMLGQVGRIVAAVQYKRCPIEPGAPLGIISVGH